MLCLIRRPAASLAAAPFLAAAARDYITPARSSVSDPLGPALAPALGKAVPKKTPAKGRAALDALLDGLIPKGDEQASAALRERQQVRGARPRVSLCWTGR